MSNNIPQNGMHSLTTKLIDFNDLKKLKKKKDTAEIVRFIAQQVCQDCIDEYHKIKSELYNK